MNRGRCRVLERDVEYNPCHAFFCMEAVERAYSVIGKQGMWFDGMEYRTDIGK